MNNKLPQITFVFDRHRKATKTRKGSVEIRITHNYKQRYISTGVKLFPDQWKNGTIVNVPDIIQVSQVLDSMLNKVKKIIYDMLKEGNMDISTIQERMKKVETINIDFISFCEQRAVIRKFGKRKDTQDRYDRFIRLFKEWRKIKDFSDITDNNIIMYDSYLKGKGMKDYSKWNNYHRFLNSFIMDAINEGHIRRNPYKWVNISKDKKSLGIERCLTPEEFHRLRGAEMPTKSIEKVRDVFVFQTYTCLSYSDLRRFNKDLLTFLNNTIVYTGKRIKTNTAFTIPILQPAIEILDKYNEKLPVISNVKYNEYLKVVAQAAKIDKPLSSHWARHTGATMLLNEGVPMQIVPKICGHSSTKITERIYAKLLDETVVRAIKEIEK